MAIGDFDDRKTYAVGGAIAGGVVGGPVGAAAGGLGGYMLGGLLEGSDPAPQAGLPAIDWSHMERFRAGMEQSRAQQLAASEMLRRRAMGMEDPTIQRERGQNIAAARSAAASARGGSLGQALAATQAQQQLGQANIAASQQAAINQLGYEQAYAQQLAAQRAADAQMFGAENAMQLGQAGLVNQVSAMNLEAQTGYRQAEAQEEAGFMGGMGSMLGGML